jgi:predicted enzyme related to lactoylglutathione lyase
MGERTKYTPGTFSWVDLATPDPEGAKAFYAGLFGWEGEDFPVGDGAIYSMQRVGGKDVCAIATQPQQQREAGVPPLWNSYVSVESADAAVERATELGGSAHAPAFDVMEAGRMAVLQDPQGAFFMVWEARDHIGAGLVNAPSAFVWNELHTPDLDGAQAFYGGLFGWGFAPFEDSPDPYFGITVGEAANGGITSGMQPGTPPHWLVYFATEEIDSGLAKATELGGTLLVGPIDIGIAKFGVVQDPQGAIFAIYAGQLTD